jgi:hypothetical protein
MMTLFLIVLILIITYICSFELTIPKCQNCKSFITYSINPQDVNLGLCKIFASKIDTNKGEKLILNYAKHCRDNEFLCGKNGWLYESNYDNDNENENERLNESNHDNEYINFLSSQKINELDKNSTDFILKKIDEMKINFKDYKKNFSKDEKKAYKFYSKNTAKYNIKTQKYKN